MAALSDFASIYAPATQQPAAFDLASSAVAGGLSAQSAGINQQRILRNFSQFDLPDLVNSQAARGAFRSSATQNKANRLGTMASDALANQQLASGGTLAQLGVNQLLAQTGIQI